MLRLRRTCALACLVLAASMGMDAAQAAVIEWRGTTSTAWGTGSNWSSGSAPGSADDVVFYQSGAANLPGALGANRTVNSVRFQADATRPITITGNTLTLNSSGTALAVERGATSHSISSNVTLGASQTWSIEGPNAFTVSGVAAGANSLTKTGDGTLILTGVNTFSGGLNVNGGVVEVSLERGLGSTGNTVSINGGAVRATASFTSPNTRGFVLNSGGGTLDVGSGLTWTVQGAISGTGGLTKAGAGTLDLEANNTYSGATTINAGTLSVSGANGRLTNTSSITVNPGATFTIDDNSTAATNRVNDSAGITLRDGILNYLGRNGSNSTETLGAVTIGEGASAINVQRGSNTDFAVLTLGGLSQTVGGTVHFTPGSGGGTLGNSGDNPRIIITGQANGFIGGWATMQSTATAAPDFAGYGANGVSTLTGTRPGSFAAAGAASNIQGDLANENVGTKTVNSVNFASGTGTGTRTITITGSNTLTVDSGGILTSGSRNLRFNGGTITSGSDLYTHVWGTGQLQISSNIADNGGTAVALVKSGTGTLVLDTVAKTFTGGAYVNEGTLQLGMADAFSGALSLSGTGTLALNGNNQSISSLTMSGGTISGTGTLSLTGDFTGNPGGVTSTISSNLNLGSADRTFNIAAGGLGNDMQISGVISGTGGLIKTGAGTLTLNSASSNTFTGDTQVREGRLILDSAASPNNTTLVGNLIIGSASDTAADAGKAMVQINRTGQIGNSKDITIYAGGVFNAQTFLEETRTWDVRGGQIISQYDAASQSGTQPGGGIWLGAGGVVSSGNVTGLISAYVDIANGVGQFDVDDGSQTVDLRVSGIVADTQGTATGVAKVGTGTLEFSGANTYGGGTTVSAGTLYVTNSNPSTSATGTGTVSVASGAALAGTGRIASTVTGAGAEVNIASGGHIAPGVIAGDGASAGIGTLTIAAQDVNVAGTYDWQVGGAQTAAAANTGGSSSIRDIIAVTGSITFNSATIRIDDADTFSSFNPGLNYSWLIATGTTGASVLGTTTFDRSQFTPTGGIFSLVAIGNNVYLNYTVPEPGTWALGGLALVLGGWYVRRRRAANQAACA